MNIAKKLEFYLDYKGVEKKTCVYLEFFRFLFFVFRFLLFFSLCQQRGVFLLFP